MFAHMSYEDENEHLVFRYNEEYENDLEIRKSTTIQSLYTRPPNYPDAPAAERFAEALADGPDSARKNQLMIEMQDMAAVQQ